MVARRVVVVGYDAVSPLGINLEEQWQHAMQGQSGIGRLTRFEVDKNFPVKIAGEAPSIDHLPYKFLSPREQARWVSPIFKYALLTAQRALDHSGLQITKALGPRVAITYSSAIGGLDAILDADRKMVSHGSLPLPYTNPNSCINMVSGKISMLLGATGPIASIVTACATGASSMILGAMLIEQKRADVVLCGAADFPLVKPIVAGFATMNGAFLPKEGHPEEDPAQASRPFSAHRRGFVISEGAGCIILASEEFAKAHGLSYQIAMSGWSMTSDAHHYVAPHMETGRRCIAEAIEQAGISPHAIHAVNAHATSTRVGDKVEFDALSSVFGSKLPPVTANKSLFGHAMGASSAIESILALQGMVMGVLPPTINYQPDPEIPLECIPQENRAVDQTFVLKNAFGFGGCNSCIVFERLR